MKHTKKNRKLKRLYCDLYYKKLFLLNLKAYFKDFIPKGTEVPSPFVHFNTVFYHFKRCLRIIFYHHNLKLNMLFIGFNYTKSFISVLNNLKHTTYLTNTELEKGMLTNPQKFSEKTNNILYFNSENTPDLIVVYTPTEANKDFIAESINLKIPITILFPAVPYTTLKNKFVDLVQVLLTSLLSRSLKTITLNDDKKKKI
jgi:hypothetical protein